MPADVCTWPRMPASTRAIFAAMYPRLGEFDSVRQRVDPEAMLQSDLARRLGICEDPRP